MINRNNWNSIEILILLELGPEKAVFKLGRSLKGCKIKYYTLTGKTTLNPMSRKECGAARGKGNNGNGRKKGSKDKPKVIIWHKNPNFVKTKTKVLKERLEKLKTIITVEDINRIEEDYNSVVNDTPTVFYSPTGLCKVDNKFSLSKFFTKFYKLFD